MARPSASQFSMTRVLNDKYLLGDEIGKGAYGRVYKGVDLLNGDFVAIKQVSLENISQDDLATIMQEIDLLKVLNHRNIVKYLGSFKTTTDLYILLEFVENGSLANIVKPTKFGALPESLAAIYVSQVLEGLVYLHDQGVIHRDIKGANILTTKQGVVKVADFGVATKLSEADGNALSVVGTPYWMAPEVIEMSGVTAAADIWSVGCTVVELITCVPPYYDLQPMPALFRIVQDDGPPIPPVSAPLADFLRLCFQKDSKARPTAAILLTHPWLARLAGTQRPTETEEEKVAILPQHLQLPPPLPPQPPSPPPPPPAPHSRPPPAHSTAIERFRDSAEDRQVAQLFSHPGLPPPALRRREACPFSEAEAMEVVVAEREGEGAVGRRAQEVELLMADLRLARPEESLQQTCSQILHLLPEEAEVRAQVVSRQSALPLTDLLSVESVRVLSSLLLLLRRMMEGCPSFHHRCGATGMFPTLLALATAERSCPDVRLSAARCLRSVCVGSPLGLSMLLACRGLTAMVGLVEADYGGQREVVQAGLDCVEELATHPHLALQLARSGLLLRLLNLMHNLTINTNANAIHTGGEGERVAALLLSLARGGEAVKAQFCSPVVMKRLVELVDCLPLPLLLPLLRCCCQLSMDPACLDPLQRANAISVMVPQLEATSTSVQSQALTCLYNLTRMNKRRQEMAAECGLVPRLMALLARPSPLHQFALPLLCDLAHATRSTRTLLRQHGALDCFLALLRDDLWAVSAVDSLAACLAHDDEAHRVEQALLKKEALERLVAFFGECSGAALVHVLDPFLRIITKSPRLNAALGLAGLTPLLVARLDHPDAIARLLLLKMIKAVYERHPRPKQLLLEHDLPRKLRSLSEDRRDGGQVLVKQMASTLLKGLVGKT